MLSIVRLDGTREELMYADDWPEAAHAILAHPASVDVEVRDRNYDGAFLAVGDGFLSDPKLQEQQD